MVLSHATHLYFDHPEEPDPEERGLYWATRYTDAHKVFNYAPDNLYANADVDINGHPVNKMDLCVGPKCVALKKPQNIKGKYSRTLDFNTVQTLWLVL